MPHRLDLTSSPWPFFAEDERAAADSVLASGKVNYWTGQQTEKFEQEFARCFGASHATAVANGSLAIDLALTALGIGPGDEVIMTPRSFFAATSSVVLRDAVPVFADIDPDSQNITAETIEPLIGPNTRAIMPVHLAGWPCDMASIMRLARAHDLKVIEDCAQAHGASIQGKRVGTFGDAAAFSFCQDKIMTTGGEGGMMLTNSSAVWDAAWSFRDHGKSYEAVHRSDHPPGYRWLHESFGSNYRLTEMQAAIGRAQLRKLPRWLKTRRAHAQIYSKTFARLAALRTPLPVESFRHVYYKFYTFIRPERLKAGWSRDRIIQEISKTGTPCFSGSCPEIYREKAVQDRGLGPSERLPVAQELGETSLMFLVHPTLTIAQVKVMAQAAARIVAAATR